MDKNVRTKLVQIRDEIDELLNQEELTFVDTFYGVQGKYKLYLFPKSTEKRLNWYDARGYCKSLGGEFPTIGELQFIFDNELDQTFEWNFYWSSTDHSDTKKYKLGFSTGIVLPCDKTKNFYIRPVKRCYMLHLKL